MTRKMNKQIKQIVEVANQALTNEHINSDKKDMLHGFISHILIINNMYWGYNYYTKTGEGLQLNKDGQIKQFYVV